MKKILSLVIAAIMIAGSLSAASFAEDALENPIYVDADFSSDAAAGQHFYAGNFKSTGEHLAGYTDAMAFQSVGYWASYDTMFRVNFSEDDLAENVTRRSLAFVYINPNMKKNGVADDDYLMTVSFDVNTDQITLFGNSFWPDEGDHIIDPVPYQIEDGVSYEFGISITQGRIRVFANGELVIDFVDEENKYYIGYSYEDVEPSILLWWNDGNCLVFEDVIISAPAHLYPFPVPVNYGDTNGDEKINLQDAALLLKHIEKWEGLEIDLAAADVTADEKVNLSDVSQLLKYIAKWDYIVLGPHEEHSFGDWQITVEPTLTEEGSRERICSVCGECEMEPVPVLTPDDPA